MQYAIELYYDEETEKKLFDLAKKISDFFRASDLLLHEFQKICGEFVSIGLVKITFPVEEIFTVGMNRCLVR